MANSNKKTIHIDFQLDYIQRNEEGIVEVLFFKDNVGTKFALPFDPRIDYTLGITIEIIETYYQVYKKKGFDILATQKVISNANGQEIKSDKLIDEELLINILFKKNKSIKFQDKRTQEDVELVRYVDASGNNLYLNKQDFYEIFLSEEEKEYAAISVTYEDLEKDYQKTLKKFPNSNFTNISPRNVKKGRLLDQKEFDYSILQEIFNGQKAKDEKYNGESIFDIYQEVEINRREAKVKNENKIKIEEEIDYGFIISEETNQQTKINTIEDEYVQKISELEKQLQQKQNTIENLLKENRKQDNEIKKIKDEYDKIRVDYLKLRKIFDGEDEEFTAVIYPVS